MQTTFTNPVLDSHALDHGDPFVFRHGAAYYLFHTTDDGRLPISAHRSHDLVRWEFLGPALSGVAGSWAETDLWAPEVIAGPGGASVSDMFAAARH